jgi:hypothetical protein
MPSSFRSHSWPWGEVERNVSSLWLIWPEPDHIQVCGLLNLRRAARSALRDYRNFGDERIDRLHLIHSQADGTGELASSSRWHYVSPGCKLDCFKCK